MKRKEWYEKYIGYAFCDNGKDCILEDIYTYEDGRKCYQVYWPESGERGIMDYSIFKEIAHQTALPR